MRANRGHGPLLHLPLQSSLQVVCIRQAGPFRAGLIVISD